MDSVKDWEKAPKYLAWVANLLRNGCKVGTVRPLHVIPKKSGGMLFALLSAEVECEGRPLMPFVFIRGHACLVVTVVANESTGEEKFLMIRQRRIGNGGAGLEFPAGMLDESVDDPLGVAVREVKEETGLDVRREDLRSLNASPLYSSPGLDDEAIYFYACSLRLSAEEFASLEGKSGGLASEQEFIQLSLHTYEDAIPQVTSLQVRLAFFLYFQDLGTSPPHLK